MRNQTAISTSPSVEPLTRREQDILKLLAQNLSDREIAERLTMAITTVKWYARQVYAKLGVENRRGAVQRAAELGLLPRPSPSRPTHNLPRQISQLIGREQEIAQVVEMVWAHPLATLTGPGGVGKTRLALAAGDELLDDFENGVWFVEIAPLSDPLLVERTLADVLGVREEPGRSLRDSLVLYLQDRQALLIFDNCEHMLDACAALAADLLKRLPRLKVLTSSREPLGVTGEAVFRVPSLSFPPVGQALVPEQMAEFEAVRLFIERARATLPGFNLDQRSAAAVSQICRRLDGIPLAIELAASRVSGLDVEQIAARLDQSFRLLSGSRSAIDRHRTLRAAIDWSYNLLAEKERLILRRLTVFVGGCTLEAAEAVCSGTPILHSEILDLLFQLTNKSMLVVEQSQTGEARYHLLETIRQYAEDKQEDPNEIERLRRRHCGWFAQFAEAAEPILDTGEYPVWIKKLDADVDNLRAALEWSIGLEVEPQEGIRIINALALPFWSNYYYLVEAERWTVRGMAALANLPSVPPLLQVRSLVSAAFFELFHGPPIMEHFEPIFELCRPLGEDGVYIRGKVLAYLGFHLALNTGDLINGLGMLNEAEGIFRQAGDPGKPELATCLHFQTWVRSQLGDLDGALASARESSAIAHEQGSIWADIDEVGLGDVYYKLGEYDKAESIFKKAVEAQHELNDPRLIDHWHRKLGDLYRVQSKFEQAISSFQEALTWTVDMADWPHVVWLQCCFAFTALALARDLPDEDARKLFLRAVLLLGALQPVMAETGEIFPVEYRAEHERVIEMLREKLDPANYEAAWAEGQAMNRKKVVAYLMEYDG